MESIFKEVPDVAYGWIATRLEWVRHHIAPYWFGLKYDRALPAAVAVLTKRQRKQLIDQLFRNSAVSELARCLVAKDSELYNHLLSREDLAHVRLAPLQLDSDRDSDRDSRPENQTPAMDERWNKMAVAAIENGFSEEDFFWLVSREVIAGQEQCPQCLLLG